MAYDPDQHERKSLRLPHYDYRSPGLYFITICTYQRQCLLGEIVDSVMHGIIPVRSAVPAPTG
jgi:putative transposase